MSRYNEIKAAYDQIRSMRAAGGRMNEVLLRQLSAGLRDYMQWPPEAWTEGNLRDSDGREGTYLKVITKIGDREIVVTFYCPKGSVRFTNLWKIMFENEPYEIDNLSQESLDAFYDKASRKIDDLARDTASR